MGQLENFPLLDQLTEVDINNQIDVNSQFDWGLHPSGYWWRNKFLCSQFSTSQFRMSVVSDFATSILPDTAGEIK